MFDKIETVKTLMKGFLGFFLAFAATIILFFILVTLFGFPKNKLIKLKVLSQQEEQLVEHDITRSSLSAQEEELLENDDDSSEVNKTANGSINLTKPSIVEYENDEGKTDYAYYFRFVNNGDEPVRIKRFDVKAYNSDAEAFDEPICVFAPDVLEPGEVGIGGYVGINYMNDYPSSGITMSATPVYTEISNGEVEDSLKCKKVELKEGDFNTTGNVQDHAVSVTIKNKDGQTFEYIPIMAGMLDSSGKLIGLATGLSGTIPANEKVKVRCDELVLMDGYTIDDVDKIQARVNQNGLD